jgi:hypothetical protein
MEYCAYAWLLIKCAHKRAKTKMKQPLNQGGFSALDTVLAVVLVAAIGAASYFAMQNMHKTTSPTASASPLPHATPSPTPSNVEKDGMLTIAQFGVSMTVPSGLSGLSYTYTAANEPTADLISSQLKGQQSVCGGAQGKGSISDGNLGNITQSDAQPKNMDGSPYTGALMKKIGAKYYFLGLPNGGPCFTGALAQTETSQRAAIQQAFSTLK